MQINKFNYLILRTFIVLVLSISSSTILYGFSYASEQLQSGNRYKIVGQVYLSGIYRDLNNRQLNKQMAVGSLTAVRFSGPEVAFQDKVPLGTIVTIIGPAPKRLPFPFFANRYFIRLHPDLSRGLDVVLELNRGIEGDLDGLNPELFSRQENQGNQSQMQDKEIKGLKELKEKQGTAAN
jgi:hypothetical protein